MAQLLLKLVGCKAVVASNRSSELPYTQHQRCSLSKRRQQRWTSGLWAASSIRCTSARHLFLGAHSAISFLKCRVCRSSIPRLWVKKQWTWSSVSFISILRKDLEQVLLRRQLSHAWKVTHTSRALTSMIGLMPSTKWKTTFWPVIKAVLWAAGAVTQEMPVTQLTSFDQTPLSMTLSTRMKKKNISITTRVSKLMTSNKRYCRNLLVSNLEQGATVSRWLKCWLGASPSYLKNMSAKTWSSAHAWVSTKVCLLQSLKQKYHS